MDGFASFLGMIGPLKFVKVEVVATRASRMAVPERNALAAKAAIAAAVIASNLGG
jgi:hypothetical protein